MHLEFHGAARSVTGSRHVLEVAGRRILLDCGMFQGRREETEVRNKHFGFSPPQIDAVVLSHAHIDHSGALPNLVKAGFSGRIHATFATADLLTIMLKDSASIQERDAEFVSSQRMRNRLPAVAPLYTMQDTERALKQVQPHGYHAPFTLFPGTSVQFYDAGHILGSAIVELTVEEQNRKQVLVFTGDLGRRNIPILRDPENPPHADALLIESTYGNREHAPTSLVDEKLADVINRVCARGGRLIIPAFAVGRTQELVFAISRLLRGGKISACNIYVDSPLANDVTEVFARHPECFDKDIRSVLDDTGDPFGLSLLHYVRDAEESKALNNKSGPFLVISSSGMCEAGRIRHHLKNNLGDPKNAVLIVGYQAEHTLGRRLVAGDDIVRIFGEPVERRAEIVVMNEFSAHADKNELTQWISGFKTAPGRAFIVHGEERQSLPFAAHLQNTNVISQVDVPELGQIITL